MNARTLVARLRRLPGLTPLPVCPVCGEQRAVRDFTRAGRCKPCEAQLALDYAVRMNEELGPDGQPKHIPPTGEWEER